MLVKDYKYNKHKVARNKARLRGDCVNCFKVNDRSPLTICSRCQEKRSAWDRARLVDLKTQCFEAYGGRICACPWCFVSELDFLGLDHVFNDGNVCPYKGRELYRQLKKLGFPDKDRYRVLCHNCNLGRHINGGTCPHESV